MTVISATFDTTSEMDSESPILASSILEGMTIRVPNRGPVSIAHVIADRGEILITSSVHDIDVDAPIARFPYDQQVSRIYSSL